MNTTSVASARSRNQNAKAERLIADGRCHPLAATPGKVWAGVIEGDTHPYLVTVVDGSALPDLGTGPVPSRSTCQCTSYVRTGACAHALAGYKLLIASTPAEDLFAQASV